MRVTWQIRLVHWAILVAAVLFVIDVALSVAELVNLGRRHFVLVSEAQLVQVHTDVLNTLLIAALSAVVTAGIAVFRRRESGRVRGAVLAAVPFIVLATLCFLVGGPQWAVAPTGDEPELLRQEYQQAVPDWYTTPHGITALGAAALLVLVWVFMFRTDVREYYLDGDRTAATGYTSWVERTGGS